MTGSDDAYWPASSSEIWQMHGLNLSKHGEDKSPVPSKRILKTEKSDY
jgi:hypothetical protein